MHTRSRRLPLPLYGIGFAGLAALAAISLPAGCGSPPEDQPDAAVATADAASADAAGADAAVLGAAENIVGVWQQPVTGYPSLMLVWIFAAEGWGNVDVRSSSGSWCRNFVSWQIASEQSPVQFSLDYTFEAPPCGDASQGDTLTLGVLGQAQADPLVLDTDWGGGAQMTLCTRALDIDDACGVGDDRGIPSSSP